MVGNCLATKGLCQCPAGWTGDGCYQRKKRPCTDISREWGFEMVGRVVDNATLATYLGSSPGTTPRAQTKDSLCAGTCDDDIAACFCPSHTPQGRVPAGERSLPNAPPVRRGREMSTWCQPRQLPNGSAIWFGTRSHEELYGAKGWCVAEQPEVNCDCMLDGWTGLGCSEPVEHTCVNQCNGHGDCNLGFCKCHEGWFGHDCAHRMLGVPVTPGLETDRPWIEAHVETPAALDPAPGQTRLRPLIWVYELPSDFNSLLLQYRGNRGFCTNRLFEGKNSTRSFDGVYDLEFGFHEMLLQSPHRTLDPEEADYFFVPVYTSCLIFPTYQWADGPLYYGPHMPRVLHATNLLIEAQIWIKAHYPYWNRKNGKDHIWMVTHDEGSCWVPKSIKNSTILSFWGRTEPNHISVTGYQPDNYSMNIVHPLYQPKGSLSQLSTEPCYDPAKDMVVPLMKSPNFYRKSPLLGAPARPRTMLAMFRGRIMFDHLPHSRGQRQRLAKLAWENDWANRHNIWILTYGNKTEGSYEDYMLGSTFCIAVMGDGFTSKYEDAILHGCIPVVVMDGADPALTNVIDQHDVSVRVTFDQLDRMPELLASISKKEVARLQANIRRFGRRFAWSSLKYHEQMGRKIMEENLQLPDLDEKIEHVDHSERVRKAYNLRENDAMQTLMEWLYGRL